MVTLSPYTDDLIQRMIDAGDVEPLAIHMAGGFKQPTTITHEFRRPSTGQELSFMHSVILPCAICRSFDGGLRVKPKPGIEVDDRTVV